MDNYFLLMIRMLRQNEEILLYANILTVNKTDSDDVIDFLHHEYINESIEYPYTPPNFNKEAALWAAKIMYIAAQLILYRENKAVDLPQLLPEYSGEIDATSILSVDLCFRFLPYILTQLKMIDTDDDLILILEKHLLKWHYAAINYKLPVEQLDFSSVVANQCVHQLYINRIIEFKNLQLANHSACIELIKASLGIFEQEFWNDFKIKTNSNE
ncbi:MAG: hypothetical protein ACOVO1_03575 [Chitinophagaceae bacterium]